MQEDTRTNETEKADDTAGLNERLVIPEYTQGVCEDGTAILMDGRPLTPDEIVQLLNANERLLYERQKVLDAIPECEKHGMNCVPNALEWIKIRV